MDKSYAEIQRELDLLSLANAFEQDEWGEQLYTFEKPAAKMVLRYSVHDYDVDLEVWVPAQAGPVVRFRLEACNELRVVDDKRGAYLEFVGYMKGRRYTHGDKTEKLGIRIRLAPDFCVEPFFAESD